jgi:phosphoglycerol transferase MdoB-like AlkP superfamily enzyme
MGEVIMDVKSKFFARKEKRSHEKWDRMITFLNRYSLLFHAVSSFGLVFAIEWISRRSFTSTCSFVNAHTMAYFYNSFIVFTSLAVVYLFRRRAFFRIFISGFWMILGVINGCILSNRVTPFGYTDIKNITELFMMTNTNYFTKDQATMVVAGTIALCIFLVLFFWKGPKYTGRIRRVVATVVVAAALFISLPTITVWAQDNKVVATYYSNIAQGYENYGFVYSFSYSAINQGMNKPDDYSEETVQNIEAEVDQSKKKTTATKDTEPNVIVVLLESFCDPDEINFLDVSKDPIPTFHALKEKYSTGYLTVPVVGAGTANSEMEVLTGMSLQYFGTGETPYKTIMKKIDQCESVASVFSSIGYGTHAVHNNGGNFYSRANAFSKMGFDTFTSKELMDITTYTPNGSWATDDILVGETIKAMDATKDQSDFVYTITVGSHGDYPKEQVIENPTYVTSGATDEASQNSWDYYVNQLNEVDTFMSDLIKAVDERDEDTMIVFFGDHLPTMGLTNEDMKSGDIYKTEYVTYNNFGMEKEDADLYAYQLMAHVTDQLGIHEGTLLSYHQTQSESEDYYDGLENLQYDLLYGEKYSYSGQNLYPATDIVMGIDDVVIDEISQEEDGIHIKGSGFTKWSKVYVNGTKISTGYVSGNELRIKANALTEGDSVVVNQVGSSNTIFRSSNEVEFTTN